MAEFIAYSNSIEVARTFSRPILDRGPAASYWVQDFLEAWVCRGLEVTSDAVTYAAIWQEMVLYAMTLPQWQPRSNAVVWCPAESLAPDLVGLHRRSASVLGKAEHQDVVTRMAAVFGQWASAWLKYPSATACFAQFLTTESGRVLLAQGIKQLSTVTGAFEARDWQQYGLGALLTEAASVCWKHLRQEIESQPDLRKAFLGVLTELCARQIPEALHLRSRVSSVLSPS